MGLEKVFAYMVKLAVLTLMKLRRRLEIQETLERFDVECIYNWDETGLYFKLLSSATYTSRSENRKNVRGTKAQKAKDRITLITCTNATGTYKIPLAMIGKPTIPRCFRIRQSPVPYNFQKTLGMITNSPSGGSMMYS